MNDGSDAAQSPRVLFLCTANYYRSRFAEVLFNALARARGLGWIAESAGLASECSTRNLGPISAHALEGLRARKLELDAPPRWPIDVTTALLTAATRRIALKELEHRPMVRSRFPEWEARIEYWDVHDLDAAVPADALRRVEERVRALVDEIAGERSTD